MVDLSTFKDLDLTSTPYGHLLFMHSNNAEAERLTALAGAFDQDTIHRLERFGIQPGWNCLEIGSGVGTIAHWLATQCPHGEVIATDLDTSLISEVGRPSNLRVIAHDVTVDDFPEGSFDLICSRFVFEHLIDRDAVLAKVVRWLAPGGWLLLEDTGPFPFDSSPNPLYRKVSKAIMAVATERMGSDYGWSRSFPAQLRANGLIHTGVHASSHGVGGTPMGRAWRLTAEHIAADLGAQFGITAADFAEFADQVESPSFDDLCIASVAAWGQRPSVPTMPAPRQN
ncbi:class I SAM-dependent methyltransferase [Micromonospora sp. MH33]|uniref:class I SAM-dependent methyltransferase n=1 Tax=Micromonospora sp. MH33 TaxID=1945509 RepID=UPI00143D57BA|nr:class I SAM-dependent methyltransferase [Micromonospora sp. MH33]